MTAKTFLFILFAALTTGFLIAAFLSGVVIENPYQGTWKGGIFAMIGVGIIFIVVPLLASFIYRSFRDFFEK
jgi:hypothetical protein